jgi:hypothetical protein
VESTISVPDRSCTLLIVKVATIDFRSIRSGVVNLGK